MLVRFKSIGFVGDTVIEDAAIPAFFTSVASKSGCNSAALRAVSLAVPIYRESGLRA